jgi:ATP-dependent Lon protease
MQVIIELIKQIIINEYIKKSYILRNISLHIDKSFNDHLINNKLRSNYIKSLNTTFKNLQNIYNSCIRKIQNHTKFTTEEINEIKKILNLYDSHILNLLYDEYVILKKCPTKINFTNFCLDLYDNKNTVLCIGGAKRYSSLVFEKMKDNLHIIKNSDIYPFFNKLIYDLSLSKIYFEIKKLVKQIGFLNIEDSLKFFLDTLYENEHEQLESLKGFDIIKNSFIPIKSFICKNNFQQDLLIEQKNIDDSNYENPNFKYSLLLNNCYKITIKLCNPNISIINIGYFEKDHYELFLKTSKLSTNNFLYLKFKKIKKHLIDISIIESNFKKNFIKNIQFPNILSCSTTEFIDIINNDYELYKECINTNFKLILEIFLNCTIKKKYNIIRVLLLGNKQHHKRANFLFTLLKDQNVKYISDIIYSNLTYRLQNHLRTANYYFKDEFERLKNLNCNDIDLNKEILLSTTMPDTIKKYALSKINEMKTNQNEYHRYYQTIRCLIDYPWIHENNVDIFDDCQNNYEKCRTILNKYDTDMRKYIYGHDNTIKKIRELVGKWMINPLSMGKAIGLCGGPGVGKTYIAQNLGKVLGIPLEQINVGGSDDACILTGHSITYSGSQYGLILKKMCIMGKPRCILFFDELDKACKKHGINEIHNTLVHIIDPNSKDKFNDKFFQDIVFPLSKVLFIFSFNDITEISQPLLDRMDIVNVDSYSLNEKLIIARDYILNEISDEYKFERKSIIFSDEILLHIIDKYTNESGVRGLKIILENIFATLNLDRIYEKGLFYKKKYTINKPLYIKLSNIKKYINEKPAFIKKIYDKHEIGHILGLYATLSGGGGVLPIIMHKMYIKLGGSQINITGNQSKIMMESVTYSSTIALNSIKKKYRNIFLKKYEIGIHIHTPDGSSPKDGPSAGSAFTTAFISVILNKHIKRDIAITGEIERKQNISGIGGLEQKIIGAKKAGVKLVLCPCENISDIDNILKKNPKLIKIWNPNNDKEINKIIKITKQNNVSDEFRVMFVNGIYDILKYSLIENIDDIKNNYDTFEVYFEPNKYLK